MLEKLYDALRETGIPDEMARAAAIEVAEFNVDIAKIRSDLKILKAIAGLNLALTLAALIKLFAS